MTLLISFEKKTTPFDAGLIEIDVDPSAERYVVMDRVSLMPIRHDLIRHDGNVKIIVPLSYVANYNLMVLIIDDSGVPAYYVTGNDKVQAQLVDARTVTLNP